MASEEVATRQLTEKQMEFLAECEKDFIDRYTDKETDFTVVKQIGISTPPIVEPWKSYNSYQNDDRKRKSLFYNQKPTKFFKH